MLEPMEVYFSHENEDAGAPNRDFWREIWYVPTAAGVSALWLVFVVRTEQTFVDSVYKKSCAGIGIKTLV